MRRKDSFMLSACIAASLGVASAANASDIFNINGAAGAGGWAIDTQAYFPDSQGHFGLDTLYIEESAADAGQDWFDIQVTVYRNRTSKGGPTPQDEMIAIDKKVTNLTKTHWTDFHMEIGLLDGTVLYPVSGLDFKRDPLPQEELGAFANPPMFGSSQTGAPSLWWFADWPTPGRTDTGYPGVAPGGMAQFWLGINVPGSLFQFDTGSPNGDEYATFILRQHWTPSPGAAGVLSIAGIAALRRRRRD